MSVSAATLLTADNRRLLGKLLVVVALMFGFGLMQVYFFLFVVIPVMRGKGEPAPQSPWESAEGLEWEVPSPAPFHTFETPPRLDATATRVLDARVQPEPHSPSVHMPPPQVQPDGGRA